MREAVGVVDVCQVRIIIIFLKENWGWFYLYGASLKVGDFIYEFQENRH